MKYNKQLKFICFCFLSVLNLCVFATKPVVWIYTDMSDKTIPGKNKEGTLNDPDDISAMAAYLMLANQFDTRGIVVASTHRAEHINSSNQAVWAQEFFGKAFLADLPRLNRNFGGYPPSITFTESCIRVTAERFDPNKSYNDLAKYTTVHDLYKMMDSCIDTVNILCWGSLTEPAIFTSHCLSQGRHDLLKRARFIGHWTNSSLHQGTAQNPERVANCQEDAQACAYMKRCAQEGKIAYYECGAIGQHGVVSGSPKGRDYYNRFNTSELGRIFVEGKYVFDSVDFSDAAAFLVLLGRWGVTLKDIASDGSNNPETERLNENIFRTHAPSLLDHLLNISQTATK